MHLSPSRSHSADSNDTASHKTVDTPKQQAVVNQPGIRALLPQVHASLRGRLSPDDYIASTIALRTFEASILVYITALIFGIESSLSYGTELSLWQLRRPRWLHLLPNRTWKGMLPASLLAAASLPMLFQGILHMPSLPVLVMLFPIIFSAESIALFIHDLSQQRQNERLPWRALVTLLGSGVLLYNEYRLMVPGLIWGVLAPLFMGVARALFAIGSTFKYDSETRRLQSFHGFIIMTLLSGLVFSFALSYFLEKSVGSHPMYPILGLVFLNTSSLIATVFTGSSLLVYSPISMADTMEDESSTSMPGSEPLASFASSILVLVAVFSSRPATVVSLVQIVAYIFTALCVLRVDQAHGAITRATNLVQTSLLGHSRANKPRKVVSISIVSLLALSLAFTLSVLESSSLTSVSSRYSTVLDLTYDPLPSPFDIVVSAYLEDPESIKAMLDSIKKTAYISTRKVNVILYTKDPDANATALKESTGANAVHVLENVGREGATFLHHIVTSWDVLAEKTMFIQAHAHNIRELVPRINSYLVADTGMLSLGFGGVTCDCTNCQDRWGWKDIGKVAPTIFHEIYNETCSSNTRIVLTYKGQFVASAGRIRGIGKPIYEKLLATITTKDGFVLGGDYKGYQDSVNNPDFGFTLERMWGLIMQCATDGRVGARCPSLLSGKATGGDVRDCQCLDLE